MLSRRAVTLALLGALGCSVAATRQHKGGSFESGGHTKVSAMMMFLGNEEKVYIMDKAEMNEAMINGHPAYAAVWDINTHETELMDIKTNTFCAGGMHLPNGSFIAFGGNKADGPLGAPSDDGQDGVYDSRSGTFDGRKALRLLNPCTSDDDMTSEECRWYDDPSVLSMQKERWYAGAEAAGDGSVVIMGGFVVGGFVNRNLPNVDPAHSGGLSEPTYEFFPANGRAAQDMQFLIKTSGLNAYVHSYLMPSGKMFVQANYSTILWDFNNNVEKALPDMPRRIIRSSPAGGAAAMLPLTPFNNYTPTILFCGGSDMPDEAWGNFTMPGVNPWEYTASNDCQRITPEPHCGCEDDTTYYVQDDIMLEPRTMGQFIALPDGKYLMINGGRLGTAGYSYVTPTISDFGKMPYGMSLAADPVLTPALYDPDALPGQRWSNKGYEASEIPRLYHSTALLLPDASVLIAGSNPNIDVNTSTIYPTEYRAEIFYPHYFNAPVRPKPIGVPKNLSYGGKFFDITIPADSYTGQSNHAAEATKVTVVRPGWTTHGLNFGQRYLELNTTYTVNDDASITIHTSQMPPNANIFQPGPALIFVVINGVPSNGTHAIIGSGNIEEQPLFDVEPLPNKIRAGCRPLMGTGPTADE